MNTRVRYQTIKMGQGCCTKEKAREPDYYGVDVFEIVANGSSKIHYKSLNRFLNSQKSPSSRRSSSSSQTQDTHSHRSSPTGRASKNSRIRFSQDLALNYATFNSESLQTLSLMLFEFPNLLSLRLKDCKLGYVGLKMLFECMNNFKNLRVLDLSGNYIDQRCILFMNDILPLLIHLEILLYSNNHIGDYELQSLSRVFRYMLSLRILHLDHNSISDKCVDILSQQIQMIKPLTELNISNNFLLEKSIQTICKSFQGRKNFKLIASNELVSIKAQSSLVQEHSAVNLVFID